MTGISGSSAVHIIVDAECLLFFEFDRCLVKMQKRGQGNCPMCRSPTVLVADRCKFYLLFLVRTKNPQPHSFSANVDWALLNFMRDWFPIESKKKLRQNEQEVAQEEMEELGLNINGSCIIA